MTAFSLAKDEQNVSFTARIGHCRRADYEVLASIVPSSPNPEGKPVITLDVATEGGKRRLAKYQWRLGQFECADALTEVELRLPFAIAGRSANKIATNRNADFYLRRRQLPHPFAGGAGQQR